MIGAISPDFVRRTRDDLTIARKLAGLGAERAISDIVEEEGRVSTLRTASGVFCRKLRHDRVDIADPASVTGRFSNVKKNAMEFAPLRQTIDNFLYEANDA